MPEPMGHRKPVHSKKKTWTLMSPCRSDAGRTRTGKLIGLSVLFLTLNAPGALANTMTSSTATLDWTGLTFSVTGGLTGHAVTGSVDAGSSASTMLGASSGSSTFSYPYVTSESSSYSTSEGNADAYGSTDDGFLSATSRAAATSDKSSQNGSKTGVDTDWAFWFYGTGDGLITVSVPYTLSVTCNPTPPSPNTVTAAEASVSLYLGTPAPGMFASDTASCQNGPVTKSGRLTASAYLTNPTWGPLLDASVSATTSATASMPEPSSLTLLGMVLLGFVCSLKLVFLSHNAERMNSTK